ncbi:uncharacterized protein PHACADRAFT_249110 [Phanerochaete carnosa HHB-10118-sp]|uniref:Uncharacterized protein n=1 Tax=Phanerochaete carnosa (strain HHB-10118-sp) TaxID=650164 RepID=K5W501_PHACS|nr:uncharacterized protein PHACADRAFT_249110 [Phanerochaete carnosa HHB-10118-sp]EKM58973.1 hypothetical protein PHACADRAFT_249110 [Phanerochaete carnosa HHB-10118-sp]
MKLVQRTERETYYSHQMDVTSRLKRLAPLYKPPVAPDGADEHTGTADDRDTSAKLEPPDLWDPEKQWLEKAEDNEMACASEVKSRAVRWHRNLDNLRILYRAGVLGNFAVCDAFAYLRVPVRAPVKLLGQFALASLSPIPQTKAAASGTKPTRNPANLFALIESTHYTPDITSLKDKADEHSASGHPANLLSLPLLIAEWKKESVSGEQAANQHYINHVAGVRFLQACGITDIPLFGLRSSGPVLLLDYAYASPPERSEDDPFVIICDRNAFKFDLENSMGIWRFASTIFSINRLHVPKLLEKWKAAADVLYNKMPTLNTAPSDCTVTITSNRAHPRNCASFHSGR